MEIIWRSDFEGDIFLDFKNFLKIKFKKIIKMDIYYNTNSNCDWIIFFISRNSSVSWKNKGTEQKH